MFANDFDEARSYHERGQVDLAITKYQALLNKDPHNAVLLYYLGTAYLQGGYNGMAANLLIAACNLKPNFGDGYCNLGVCYKNELHSDRAQMAWEAALKCEDQTYSKAGVLANIGGLYVNAGCPEKAIEWYDKALKLTPDDAHTKSNKGLALLEMGQWKEGWELYEYGIKAGSRKIKQYGLPYWEGKEGETVIVCGEQGIGDEIMFASVLPDIIRISKRVILDCHPRLERLFKRSFPTVEVHPTRKSPDTAWVKSHPEAKQLLIGSLGKFFRPNAASFPKTPYLKAEAQGFKGIGIAWAGGAKNTNAADRSLVLSDLAPILKAKPATFYSLQYTASAARDVCQFEGDTGIAVKHWPKYVECFDYDITAGFVAGLDSIVSVCTTMVHLAGALGVPCLCLTPKKVAWRYGLTGDSMPWYNSVKTIRQDKAGEWGPVIDQAVKELTK